MSISKTFTSEPGFIGWHKLYIKAKDLAKTTPFGNNTLWSYYLAQNKDNHKWSGWNRRLEREVNKIKNDFKLPVTPTVQWEFMSFEEDDSYCMVLQGEYGNVLTLWYTMPVRINCNLIPTIDSREFGYGIRMFIHNLKVNIVGTQYGKL